MQVSVSLSIELSASEQLDINSLEQHILTAGRAAMAELLRAAVHKLEMRHCDCPYCGTAAGTSVGTDSRVVLTKFGRVVLVLRRLRCRDSGCARRWRPAEALLAPLQGGNLTAELRQACVLAGSSWPFQSAATLLQQLCGAQVSAESVRQCTEKAGAAAAERQVEQAQAIVAPPAVQVRAERQAALLRPLGPDKPVERLLVGLDGGWVPSKDQRGGMEGKVGVVATGSSHLGQGRQRLSPRRYVATFADAARIGMLTYAAAYELGGEDAIEQVLLGDGAKWIKTQAAEHFPRSTKILDFAHLSRVVHKAVRAAWPGKQRKALRREIHQRLEEQLWAGEVGAAQRELEAMRLLPNGERRAGKKRWSCWKRRSPTCSSSASGSATTEHGRQRAYQ